MGRLKQRQNKMSKTNKTDKISDMEFKDLLKTLEAIESKKQVGMIIFVTKKKKNKKPGTLIRILSNEMTRSAADGAIRQLIGTLHPEFALMKDLLGVLSTPKKGKGKK